MAPLEAVVVLEQKLLEHLELEELAELVERSIQVSGTRFAFADAMKANEETPIAADPARTAYYIVKLVGPPKGEWLTALRG